MMSEAKACDCGNIAKCIGSDGSFGCDQCCGHAGDGSEACTVLEYPCPDKYETATDTWEESGVHDHCAGCGGTFAEHAEQFHRITHPIYGT